MFAIFKNYNNNENNNNNGNNNITYFSAKGILYVKNIYMEKMQKTQTLYFLVPYKIFIYFTERRKK